MNKVNHAFRVARRYADGGSNDEETPLHMPLLGGANPVRNVAEQRPVLQIDPLQGPGAGGVAPLRTEPEPAPPAAPQTVPITQWVGTEPSPAKPDPRGSVQHWSQAVADHLVSRHGNDFGAAEQSLRDLATNYSQRAADAVWSKMPLEHQMGMMASGMERDLGPGATRVLTETYGPGAQNKLIDDFSTWLKEASPSQVQHLSDDDLGRLHEYLTEGGRWTDIKENNPELLSAIKSEQDHRMSREGEGRYKPPVSEWEPLSEKEYGAGPEHLAESSYSAEPGLVPRDQHPFGLMSEGFSKQFNDNIATKTGDKSIYDFAKRFFGGYDTKDITAWGDRGELNLEGSLTDSGRTVAHISRSISPEQNTAHHGSLEVFGDYKGTAGPRILRGQMDTYKALGLDRVSVYAAGNGKDYVGGYAWAKYGFTPTQSSWDGLRQRFLRGLNEQEGTVTDLVHNNTYKLDDPTAMKRLKRIFEWNNPRSIWDLADFPVTVNGTKQTIGNALLSHSGWNGEFNLKDPESQFRFDSYVERKLAKPKKPTE